MEKPYDVAYAIRKFESGELSDTEVIEFFQRLVDSGLAWSLQKFDVFAQNLIDAGFVRRPVGQ